MKKRSGSRKGHMEEKFLVASLFIFIVGFGIFSSRFLVSPINYLSAIYASIVSQLANNDRAAQNIQGLKVSTLLTEAAQMKADDMAEKGYFAHISPEKKTPWYWMNLVGYKFSYAGENLAIDFSDAQAVDEAWMGSLTHRENILNKNFTEIGVATSTGFYQGKQTVFVVEMFGTPAQ